MDDEAGINNDFALWTANNWARLVPTSNAIGAVVAIRYTRIANALGHSHSATLKPYKAKGITSIADFRILGLLRHIGDTGMSTQRIAEHLEFDATTVSTRLNRLERSGHVERREHARSRRTHLVVLSPSAAPLVDEMYQALVRNHERFFGALSADEHQQLADLLGRL